MRQKIRMDCNSLGKLLSTMPPSKKTEMMKPTAPTAPPPPPKIDLPKRPPSPPKISVHKKPPSPPRISAWVKKDSDVSGRGNQIKNHSHDKRNARSRSRERKGVRN